MYPDNEPTTAPRKRSTACSAGPKIRCTAAIGARGSARQAGCAHQELVDRAGALAALADRPDHQRLAAPHVAAREDLVRRSLVVLQVRRDVAARIEACLGLRHQAGNY